MVGYHRSAGIYLGPYMLEVTGRGKQHTGRLPVFITLRLNQEGTLL
jgi:hypothetical protein